MNTLHKTVGEGSTSMQAAKQLYNCPATTQPIFPGLHRNYRKTMRLPILCTLLLVCLVTPELRSIAQTPASPAESPAQTPAQPPQQAPVGTQPTKDANGTFTIQRTARLVVLDVVVTDAKGK